ncbi:pyruvate, phosphate dikinase [Streptacidiphilus anmyonensis]|uniref:pyruvate, phosphate dikinase n=1 Tax=Streptacidiphilus anmyonensis TaxID=405782 RepID=UPI0005A8314D|nr:pyruvate, phosphate dikinase [Streptacidiphilus anmyonensis]
MKRYVYDFADGRAEEADLLGGKGAGLAEMTRLGLPVPPGFTVTTEACRFFLAQGHVPEGLDWEIDDRLATLEATMGRDFGDPDEPLLLSVRSGARFSMPGMMDTILDLGLNDVTVTGFAKSLGQERAAWDCYRRLVQMFGATVLGVPDRLFDDAITAQRKRRGAASDIELTTEDLRELTGIFRRILCDEVGRDFPQDPREQLRLAVRAVFRSWQGERARVYRRREGIPEDLGTAVNVQAMVFGNLGPDSGTGVAFTRDPATGRPGVYGDYLAEAQGEDVVAGIRNTVPLQRLAELDPSCHRELLGHLHVLEEHYRDLCDVEFTIERGRLWILQTRIGKRTAEAAFRIAAQLVVERTISLDEALLRVNGEQLTRLMVPRFTAAADHAPLATGLAASPGAAVGAAAFSSAEAVRRSAAGQRVVLVRPETSPDDLPGMLAAEAVLTSRGGRTSHAAVVARGLGKVCVCGAESLRVEPGHERFTTADGTVVSAGDVISVDGTLGTVHLGALPLTDSPVSAHLLGGLPEVEDSDTVDLVGAVGMMLQHADRSSRMQVRANADTPEDAAKALTLGARGIGLCRTEHMFLGERRQLVEDMVLADTASGRDAALARLLPLQRGDFEAILAAMDGLPVTVRLLDPPLHEFLPDRTALAVSVAADRAAGRPVSPDRERLLAAVERMHEENPMLGLRGVRLGLLVPGLVAMQVRALAEAVAARRLVGGDPHAELMVPLVDTVEELRQVRKEVDRVLAEVSTETGVPVDLPLGTMIELPRAALTAGTIAAEAEFFSFGTNDLTQTTWGLSRDDAEAAFLTAYLERGILRVSPFETLDTEGVGRLVELGVREGRATRPHLGTGVCGEHGGDPASIRFFHRAGLDYVSCSPLRVPVARLEAGRAAVSAS